MKSASAGFQRDTCHASFFQDLPPLQHVMLRAVEMLFPGLALVFVEYFLPTLLQLHKLDSTDLCCPSARLVIEAVLELVHELHSLLKPPSRYCVIAECLRCTLGFLFSF